MIFISEPDRHIKTEYRTYYPDRKTFDQGINVSKGGVSFNSKESENFWTT